MFLNQYLKSVRTPLFRTKGSNRNLNLTSLAFSKLSHLSYRSGELRPYLDTICESIIDILGEGMAAVTFYEDNKKQILAVFPNMGHAKSAIDAHDHLSTYVVKHQQTLVVNDVDITPQYGKPPEGYCSYLGVPLRLPNGEVVGTLCYFNKYKRHFTSEEQKISELFVERAAIALDNYQLFQQLQLYSDQLEDQIQKQTQELVLAHQELLQKEKLAAIGEFATRITHEIRNPLTTIRLALDYLQKTDNEKSAKRALLAANEASRLENLLNEVLLYAKPAQLNIRPLPLSQWLNDFLMTHESIVHQAGLRYQYESQDDVVVNADTDKLTQICLNLLRNACDASTARGIIQWSTGVNEHKAFITIQNHGEAIPQALLEEITEPFVSAKAGGSGLGLSIVKSLVEAHKGDLQIVSNSETGTTVTISLPLVSN